MSLQNRTLVLLASAALLAACGQNEDASPQNAGTENGMAMGDHDMNMMADPNNPFAQSEMDMDRKMMAAVGVDAADNWTAKMIEHHQGAVDMSRIVLGQDPSADVAKLAQQTIDKQGREIEELRGMRQQGTPDQRSADLYKPAMMSMHQTMMAAKGADISETYLRKMLEHHRGAVAMSDIALANGVTGPLKGIVEKTRSDQQKEMAVIEAMLEGKTLDQAMQANAAKPAPKQAPATRSAAPAKVSSTASEPKKTAAAPAKPKSDAASSDAAAAPKASATTCAPEHRAMGHC